MPKVPFLEALDARVLVCDGAMGTMLYSKGIFLNRSFDELNLTQPDLVAEVHQAYSRAGADILETNTFGANRIKLGAFSLADRVHAINIQGARIARHAARDQAYVAGAIGPLGIRIEPWGKTGVDEAEEYFREQAKGLFEGGVDLFILETFRDLNEISAAIRAVRSVCQLPVVAQMTTEDDGHSLDGTPPEQFAPALEAAGADAIGVNCSVGPAAMLETIERIARVTRARLSAQPNAGKPRDVEGRNIYLCSPEYMASYARRFILNGVKIVGGCCGTTPDHIRQIKAAVKALAPPPRIAADSNKPPITTDPNQPRITTDPNQPRITTDLRRSAAEAQPVERDAKSRMANAIARRSFVVAVELLPPRGHRTDGLVEQARTLKIHGVDIVNVPDGPRASARMSALAMAVLVQQQAGLEPILHYTCRDRNLLGMQSDLLGAHAMGVRNLLIITGDPPKVGDYPDATAVFDVDSIGLTNVVSRLNPRGSESRRGDPALRVQSRSRGRVRGDAADLRPRGLRARTQADRARANSDRGRAGAVRERPARRVSRERSARRPRSGQPARPDAAGRVGRPGPGGRPDHRPGGCLGAPRCGSGSPDHDREHSLQPAAGSTRCARGLHAVTVQSVWPSCYSPSLCRY
jgi:methionine synthase I (cobalamin-dependent)